MEIMPLAVGYTGAEDQQVADAIRYIENYQGDQPLCVYLPLMLPHPWYACTPEDFAAIQREAIEPCVRLNDRQRALKPSIEEGMRHNHRLYQWDDESLLDFKQTYLAMSIILMRIFRKFSMPLSAEVSMIRQPS